MAKTLEFFVYEHAEREFRYFDGDRKVLEEVMGADNPDQIADSLDEESIDGMLVLDEDGGRWYLAFAASLGIVGQRTARRQADTIVRSGYTLPDGYWLKAKYPMEELSDPNIGDLWQTVQQKYVKDSSLTGLELDEELGIPAQLAERAKRLEEVGEKDALSDAKLEKAEAEERAKAAAKSKGKKPAKKSKKKAKTAPKKEEPKKKETKKKEEPTKTAAKTAKIDTKKPTLNPSDYKEEGPYFIEIDVLAEYIHNDYTRMVAKGDLTSEKGDAEYENVIFDQSIIKQPIWNDLVVFLEEGDLLEVHVFRNDDGVFATKVRAEEE